MEKLKVAKIQNNVFRKVYKKRTRIRKRRGFLIEVLEDIQTLCGYSPQQLSDIVYHISVNLSFNPFLGVTINHFDKYCVGYQGSIDVKIDKIVVTLPKVLFGVFDFFKREEKYRVQYFQNEKLVLSVFQSARRF